MTPTTCTTCDAPLPAAPADESRPDTCATCAAAPFAAPSTASPAGPLPGPPSSSMLPPLLSSAPLGATVPGSVIPGRAPVGPAARPTLITRTRLPEGILVGAAMAALSGVAWWAVVTLTGTELAYGAIALGVVIGQAVLIGARKGGAGPALVAGLACLASLAVAEYFIQRSLTISNFGVDLPLWTGLSTAKDVVWDSLRGEPITGAFWAVGIIAAMASAGAATRRPVI